MPMRTIRLTKTNSPGRCEETHLLTVHHRPPKKSTPSPIPAIPAKMILMVSFMVILPFITNGFVFLVHPMPGVKATNYESGNQQGQGPGSTSGIVSIQPETECGTEECRNDHRPANQAHHSQT